MSRQSASKPRRRKFRRLTKTVAQMIVDTRAYFDREATEQKRLLLTQPVKRTAECLNVSETLVKKVCKVVELGDALPSDDEPETHERHRAVPETLFPTIRATMFAMFRTKEPVSLDSLLAKLQELRVTRSSGWVWSRATLYRVLTAELSFRFDKRPSHYRGMKEKQPVALQRLHYIRAVRRCREEGRKIFYQDETWVTKNMTPAKCWMDKDGEGAATAPSGVGMCSIVCHVGGEDGFVDGVGLIYRGKHALQGSDYHSEMNSSIFLDWLGKQVFPAIPPRSVLVIDRATYHTVLTEESKPAKLTFSKAGLVDWLVTKDVVYDIDGRTVSTPDDYMALKKVELEAICKQHKPAPVLQAQVLARRFDCDVLLLLVAHPELNPIEMVWANVKGYAAKRNANYSLSDVERLTSERFGQIGADEWSKYVRHCIKIENNYYDAADEICNGLRLPLHARWLFVCVTRRLVEVHCGCEDIG